MLRLAQAIVIIDGALAYARSSSLEPMRVAALDVRGCIVALHMEDRSSLLRPDIASGKAWGALAMGFGTRNLAGRAEKQPRFFGALAALAGGEVLPVPGGVLIRSADGSLLGAVGASGDVADNDELCVIAGIEAPDFAPTPALRRSKLPGAPLISLDVTRLLRDHTCLRNVT